jgi:DNA-binding NtrC family response regulator
MVGSKKSQKVNVKVIAATNVDLMQLVEKALFRKDLYYRLNIITIDLPPLRERDKDILELLDFFLEKYVRELGKPVMKFTSRALKTLSEYSWPGNVRELQNLVQRLVIMADDTTIDIADLPDNFRYSASRTKGLNRTLLEVEREYILDVLAANKNNISHTAQTLGIDRKTLREKIKKSGRR